MKSKFVLAFILVFAAVLLVTSFNSVSADQWYEYNEPDIEQMSVYVNGQLTWYGLCENNTISPTPSWTCTTEQYGVPALEREEDTEIKVTFVSNGDFEESRVRAWIGGYHDDIEAETSMFDIFSGNTYTKTLNLFIPKDVDARDSYTIHVDIESKTDLSGVDEADIDADIQRITNVLEIMSVELYDANHYYGYCGECTVTFDAGTTIYVDVAVKNRGSDEAEDVYVRVNINNELCIERTVYLGDLEENDDDDDEDAKTVTIALPIPSDIYPGTYTLEVKAYNDEVSDTEFRDLIIESGYKGDDYKAKEGKVEITPQITTNKIEMGKGAVYTILVANFGNEKEDFVVSALGLEGGCEGTACAGWGEATINPQAFSLAPGENKLVNVYLAVSENAVEGDHVFSVRVEYDSGSQQHSLTANVVKSGPGFDINLKTTLMIIGIILAIAIIVLLILLLTYKKTTESAEVEESYY